MSKKQEKEAPSKRQVLREQRQQRQRQQRIVLVVGIGVVILVIAGLLVFNYSQQANVPVGDIVQITPVARFQAQGNSMGNPNAPVKIVEFSDFQCPYCKQFADNTEKAIEDNYVKTGKVYFTYRSMGNWVSSNGQTGKTESQDAAMAGYCAGDQGKFWEYHDILFSNWKGEDVGSFVPQRLTAFAQTLKLDTNQFNSCLSSKKYQSQVDQDNADGRKAGVQGTPSFVINGQLVEGALPFSDAAQPNDFKRAIDAALAGK